MSFQSTIIFLLGFLILMIAMLLIIVVGIGILRIAVISVFEFDFVNWYRSKYESKRRDRESIGRD